jgi:hypothetical protein
VKGEDERQKAAFETRKKRETRISFEQVLCRTGDLSRVRST